jgi:hypothetical protein
MQPNLMKTEQIDEDEEMSFLAVDDEDDTSFFVNVCSAQTSELDRNLL